MFAAGSVKSSKWGWDIKTYNKYGVNTGSQASNVGFFTGGCLAPNGLIYCLPTYLGAQFVTVIKPGKSNSKTGKWEPATVVNVPATGTPKNPLLPDITTTAASLQRRFSNKGILAPNGLIYFFGFFAEAYIVVKPQDNPNFDISAATEWKVVTYASVGLAPVAGRSGYGGGFLHTDGKIYLLPQSYSFNGSSSPIARIVPSATYLSSDTIEKSAYWDPSTNPTNDPRRYLSIGGVASVASFSRPVNSTGTELTIPTDTYYPVYQTSGSVGISFMPPIGDAISHPNGSIYVFGGGRNAYILKVKTDSTTWNTNSNPAGAIFYTSNELRVPNKLPSGYSGALGIQGCFLSGSIEKLKPGQDPETAKIYLHYAGTWENDISLPTGYFQNNYTRTIVFDPVTETFENVGEPVATIVTVQQPFNLKPGVRMANGHIFSVSNFLSLSTVGKNPFGQLIVSGETSSDENKIIGPNSQRSILSQNENQDITSACYGSIDPVCNQGSHALLGSSLGKTFVTAPTGGFEIVSVKGFYPGIKYFNYDDNQNYSFISSVKTHTGITFNTSSQLKIVGLDLTSNILVGYPFVLSNCVGAGSYIAEDVSLQGSDTVIDVSETNFSAGVDSDAVITYGQLVEFPDNETLRIWGVDLTNSMYNVQNINIQGSSVSGNNGVKTIYTGSQPFYDNGHTDLLFNPGTFTTSGVNPNVTASFQYSLNDEDIYGIPSDLSTLPTSLYNAYFNKPR